MERFDYECIYTRAQWAAGAKHTEKPGRLLSRVVIMDGRQPIATTTNIQDAEMIIDALKRAHPSR